MTLPKQALLVAATLLFGVAAGIALYAAIGPSAAVIPAGVQAVLLTLVAAAIGGAGLLLSAAMAADAAKAAAKIASDSAALDRASAERSHINQLKATAFAEVLERASRHVIEVSQQVNVRREVADGKGRPEDIPDINSTDPIGDSLGSLYAFASQDTADAAQRVYNVLVDLDSFAYDAAKHRKGPVVTGFEASELEALATKLVEFQRMRVKLIQEVRAELGLQPLVERVFQPISQSSTTSR